MTAPNASRQSVAVSRMRCSRGGWPRATASAVPRSLAPGGSRAPGRRARRAAPAVIHAHFDGGRPKPLSTDELAKALPAGFEVLELVEARAGRGEQDDLPRGCPRPRRGERALEITAFAHLRGSAGERAGDRRGVLTDQIHRATAALDGAAQDAEVLALALAAEDQVDPFAPRPRAALPGARSARRPVGSAGR